MKIKNCKTIVALSLFILMANSGLSNVQAQVVVPGNVEPGLINKTIQETNLNKSPKKDKSNTEEVNIKAPESDDKEIPAVLKETKFKLNTVNFSGNSVFGKADLEEITANYIGKDVTISDLQRLTKQITALYQGEGYITSYAYIPPQKVQNGIVEIAISEGKIGKVQVEGNKWVRTTYLKNNMLKANDLQERHIFNVKDLRKSLGEINKQDYLKGEVILQKGIDPDTSDIILNVKDRFPLDFNVSWDNQGRELIGVQRATLGLGIENLSGFGDSISAYTAFARRTFGVGTNYSIPIGPYGTKLMLGYSMSDIELGGAYKSDKIEGRSHNFATTLVQPIYKGETFTLTSDLGFDMIHSKTRMLRTTTLNKYDLRVLSTGLNGIKDDNSGRWISRLETSVGLPIMGATDASAYGVGSGKFVKLNSSLIRVQALPWKMTGIFRAAGQYSPNALLAIEQFQLGGMNTVRGFDEGVLLGDTGYNLSAELRRPIPYLPNITLPLLPEKINKLNLKDNIQFATFYDQGWAHEIHRGRSETHRNFMQSIGVGLRCYLGKFVNANFDLGIPIGRNRFDGQQDIMFHFSLTSNLI